MDFKLAKEIYSNIWLIDYITFSSYVNILSDYRQGILKENKERLNNYYLYDLKTKQKTVGDQWDLDDLESDEKAISIIKLDGPITKHGGMSHRGTKELSAFLNKADKNPSIEGHILHINSGGGSANAVKIMADAIQDAKKPVVAFSEDMMASAAMYIGSYADYIISNEQDDLIGSIGTMIQFSGFPAKNENKQTGLRDVRIYATKSTMKNHEFEEAINEFNFKPIQEKILDPSNEQFLENISNNRPVKKEELTGEIFTANNVVGSLIDEIGNFDTAIEKVNQLNSEMGVFKKEKPINKVTFNDVECVYQGELKEGVELSVIGGNKLENGVYEKDGMNYTIENSNITKVETKQPETFSEAQVTEKVEAAVNPLKVELQEKTEENENLTAQLEEKQTAFAKIEKENAELKKLKSTHVPKSTQNVDNDKQLSAEDFQRSLATDLNKENKTEE
jgi:protease-4